MKYSFAFISLLFITLQFCYSQNTDNITLNLGGNIKSEVIISNLVTNTTNFRDGCRNFPRESYDLDIFVCENIEQKQAHCSARQLNNLIRNQLESETIEPNMGERHKNNMHRKRKSYFLLKDVWRRFRKSKTN